MKRIDTESKLNIKIQSVSGTCIKEQRWWMVVAVEGQAIEAETGPYLIS